MFIEWGSVIANGIIMLLGAGGIGWLVTAKEDKKQKQLENQQKEAELNEYKRDEVLQDWKDIAAERKARADELAIELKEHERREDEKDAIISDLKAQLDKKNTYCAVTELMRCEELSCPNRKPPFGMKETKLSDSFE